jgi:signal transduction histidine kinase
MAVSGGRSMSLPSANPFKFFGWTVAAYGCIAAAMLTALGMVIVGAEHDLDLVRLTLLHSEINRLRTHAMRSVRIIEASLSNSVAEEDPLSKRRVDYSDALRSHWATSVFKDDSRDYSAVINSGGRIVLHSHHDREGNLLGPTWYNQVVVEAGPDVVDTANKELTGGSRCYDVEVPISLGSVRVGTYHTGLSRAWLESELQVKQRQTWLRWSGIVAFMVAVVLAAGVSQFYITRRLVMYREAAKLARGRRFSEIGQLMAGIAHEIRNPLNAMRLNLHVLSRSHERAAALQPPNPDLGDIDSATVVRETNEEIERIEGLIRVLLGYARPDRSEAEILDLVHESRSILSFLQLSLERAEVVLRLQLPSLPVTVIIDRERLRQVLLNLVNNAKEAIGPGGTIDIEVRGGPKVAEIVVADNGPGVPASSRERIFELLYTTKQLGTGLGLALVRRFVEEAGGTVVCEPNEPQGARFVIRLATVSDAPLLPCESTQTE